MKWRQPTSLTKIVHQETDEFKGQEGRWERDRKEGRKREKERTMKGRKPGSFRQEQMTSSAAIWREGRTRRNMKLAVELEGR